MATMIIDVLGIRELFTVVGSVLPRAVIWGVIGAIEGGLLERYATIDEYQETFHHPYVLQARSPGLLGLACCTQGLTLVPVAYHSAAVARRSSGSSWGSRS